MRNPSRRRKPLYSIFFFGWLLCAAASEGRAQHEHDHMAMAEKPGDTLATAPTRPTRFVRDSATVADSLLSVCKPHISHSIDAYSTCLGDGIAALSSAGNIALAMGT